MTDKPFRLVDGEKVFLTEAEVSERAAEAAIEEEKARTRDLNKAQFEWLLAYTGLEDEWKLIENWLKENDKATYATIRLQRSQNNFRLEVTISFINQLKPVLDTLNPTHDYSEQTVRDAWALAVNQP